MKTEVGIIGAGPAGLMLARILQQHGIDTIILERRSRDHVLGRIRAGVLEQGTVDTLKAYGVGERLAREGIPIKSMQIRWNGEKHVTSIVDENGRHLTTYGQAKVVRDLIEQREADGLPILFEAAGRKARGHRRRAENPFHSRCRRRRRSIARSSRDATAFMASAGITFRKRAHVRICASIRSPGSAFSPRPRRIRTCAASRTARAASRSRRRDRRQSAGSTCRSIPRSTSTR